MPAGRAAFLRPRFSQENAVLEKFQFRVKELPHISKFERGNYYADKYKYDGPLHPAPWRGFVTEYRRRGDPAPKRRKKNALLWAEMIMEGLRVDQVALVEEGIKYRLTDLNCRVSGGTLGSAYRLSQASFFTKEQVLTLTGDKREALEAFAKSRRLFLGRAEWTEVLEPLQQVATYMDREPFVPAAREGDTALSLAIRLRRFDAGLALVRAGADALTRNVEGQSAVDLLETELQSIEAALREIEELKYRRMSSLLRGSLSEAEERRLKKQDHWDFLRVQLHVLAKALRGCGVKFLEEDVANARLREARCVVEGFSLTARDFDILRLEPFVRDYVQRSGVLVAVTDNSPLPEAFDPEVLEKRRLRAAMVKMQAWWRGVRCRRALERRRLLLAAFRLQLFFRFVKAWRRLKKRKRAQEEAEEEEKRERERKEAAMRPDLSSGILTLLNEEEGGEGSTNKVGKRSSAAAATVRDLLARSRRAEQERRRSSSNMMMMFAQTGEMESGHQGGVRGRLAAFRQKSSKTFGATMRRLTSGLGMGGSGSEGENPARPVTPSPAWG